MKKINLKKAMTIVLAMILALIPTFSAFAEAAKETGSEGGRTIIVQELKLGDAGASASVTRGETTFAPAAGVRLAEGDVLRTKGNAVLYLSVDAQMVLRLDSDTEAVIEKAAFGSKLVVNVKKGHMFYNVAKQTSDSESLEMMSNNITIAIRGTSGTLTFGNGTVQHMLYDGVVTVSDGKTSRTQNPGELLNVSIGPAHTMENGTAVKNFTLSDIPASVVEEMKKDADLMARILGSVPAAIGADGAKTFADAAWFTENVTGTSDAKVFSDSLKVVHDTVSSGSSDPQPDPGPDPGPTTCPYADGSKGGELYYIREVKSAGEYKVFAYRYNSSAGKFEFRGASNFSAGGSDHKAGEWVHYHIMDGFVGVCTGDGDGAVIPVMHTVKFDTNGQTVDYPPADQEIPEGNTVWKPSISDTNCCTFDGWYTEPECETEWDFDNDVVMEDMTLYAHWLPKTMRIWMQDAEGKGGPEYVDLTYGDSLEPLSTLPTNPDPDKFLLGYFTTDDEKIYDGDGSPVDGAEDLIWGKYSGLTIYAEWDYVN